MPFYICINRLLKYLCPYLNKQRLRWPVKQAWTAVFEMKLTRRCSLRLYQSSRSSTHCTFSSCCAPLWLAGLLIGQWCKSVMCLYLGHDTMGSAVAFNWLLWTVIVDQWVTVGGPQPKVAAHWPAPWNGLCIMFSISSIRANMCSCSTVTSCVSVFIPSVCYY